MVIERLKELFDASGKTIYELAWQTKIEKSKIDKFLKREIKLEWEDIQAFAKAFECSVEDFLLIDEYDNSRIIKGYELPPEMRELGIFVMTIEKGKEISDIDFTGLIKGLKMFSRCNGQLSKV